MKNNIEVGLISARIFSGFIVLLDLCYIALFIKPNIWTTYNEYVSNYSFKELLPEIIGFIFYPSFLIVIKSIVITNNNDRNITAYLTDFFAKLSTGLILLVYFVQIAIVNPFLGIPKNQSYELWMFGNPNSIAWAINYLGWFFGSISILGLSLIIKDKMTKFLCLLYSVIVGIAFIGFCIRILPLEMLLGIAWFIVMPILFFRISILFKKINSGLVAFV